MSFFSRYGPYPLAQCEPCVYPSDFIAFTVAPTVLPYLRALLLVSLITSAPTYRTAWRTPALFTLAATFFTEVWWTFDTRVPFQADKVDGWVCSLSHSAPMNLILSVDIRAHTSGTIHHPSPSALPHPCHSCSLLSNCHSTLHPYPTSRTSPSIIRLQLERSTRAVDSETHHTFFNRIV